MNAIGQASARALDSVELAGCTVDAEHLGDALAPWMQQQRWFNGKDDQIRKVVVDDAFAIPAVGTDVASDHAGYVLKTTVQHARADDVTYYVSLAPGRGREGTALGSVAIDTNQGPLYLREAMDADDFVLGWRELSHGGRVDGAAGGRLVGTAPGGAYTSAADMTVEGARIDSSNTVRFLRRREGTGVSRETADAQTEVTKFVRGFDPNQKVGSTPYPGNSREAAMLAHNVDNDGVPRYDGGVEFHGPDGTLHALGMTTFNVPNRGSAQDEAVGSVARLLGQLGSVKAKNERAARAEVARYAVDGAASQGRALAQLHLVNASGAPGSVFSGSKPSVQRRLEELAHLRATVPDVLARVQGTPEFARYDAGAVERGLLAKIDEMEAAARAGDDPQYLQIHGDFHPGQNLVNEGRPGHTITDFEGKPNQTAAENAIPQHAYDDVAQMLGSFDYAGDMSLKSALAHVATPNGSQYARRRMREGTAAWIEASKRAFLDEYHAVAGNAGFVPASSQARARALDEKLLKIMLHNVSYESGAGRGLLATPLEQLVRISGAQPAR